MTAPVMKTINLYFKEDVIMDEKNILNGLRK